MSTIISHHSSSVPTSTPILWLRADKGVILSGSTVSSWLDQSGNGYNASQSNASYQPLYVPNALNGKPVLRFDGANRFLLISNSAIPIDKHTIFIVFKTYNTSSQSIFGIWYSKPGWNFVLSSGVYTYIIDKSSAYITGTAPTIGANNLFSLTFDGSNVKSYNSGSLIQNDSSIYSSVYSNTSDALAIGIATNGVSTADPFNGDIAEIVIYNTALSDAERITVENYLKNKYAL